jgi:hypothetical protein
MTESPHPVQSTDEQAVGPARVPSSASTRSERRSGGAGSSPHAAKFRTATAVLVGCAIAAVLIAVAVASNGRRSQTSAPWSSWSPADSGPLGAREIADYLAPFYRLSATDQLSVVTVVNLQSATAAAAAAQAAAAGTSSSTSSGLQVAVRPSPSSSAVSLLTGNTVAYNLCGIGGKACAITVGTPSRNRLLLLRREALELALYTFKYIQGVQNVVAILPPGRTTQTSTLSRKLPTSTSATKPIDMAVLFVHPELQPLLDQPLGATFPEPNPPTVAQMPNTPEAGLVEQVTARGLFSEHLQQAQDGSNLIVLDPLPPQ